MVEAACGGRASGESVAPSTTLLRAAFVIASKAKQSSGGAAWIASSLSLFAMTKNYFRREIG
jgi:hypothetical protein